ncbi:hypothetical protein PAMP_012401 [Pampus punctatissimus]
MTICLCVQSISCCQTSDLLFVDETFHQFEYHVWIIRRETLKRTTRIVGLICLVTFARKDKRRTLCLHEGFKEAAEKFRMESGIEPSVDLDSLDERIKIREMILKGQIQEAIALINSLHPELLDTNRYLYFHLQQQHLIELIRLRETESALEFAQTQLAEQGEESRECLTEMERTLALLAFDNPEESPFGDLLNMMQRQKVWSEVNQAVLDYENRESTPKLAKLLKLLLWAQNELDQKKVKYPKMTDLSTGTIEDPK